MTEDTRNYEGATYTVRTTSCQRCQSRHTEAHYLTKGDVLIVRLCQTCGWDWDACEDWAKDGKFLTPQERIALLEAER